MRALKTVVERKEQVAVELRERLAAAEAARDDAQAQVRVEVRVGGRGLVSRCRGLVGRCRGLGAGGGAGGRQRFS